MKTEDLRKMTDDELAREIDALRKSLLAVRTKRVTDVEEKNHVYRQTRRALARALTIAREKKTPKA